jgi:rhodanese-related sulfurtransferase
MSVETIAPERLAELLKNNTVDLIDVRTTAEFREMHLKAAKNVPLDQLDPASILQARTKDPSQPIYVLCRSGGRGRQGCEKFRAAGFENVFNVEGGTLACVAAGLPIVYGPKTMSLERQVRITAGALVVLGFLLGWFIHPAFHGLSAFIGAGLVFAGVTDTCGMGMVLAKMPWNRVAKTCATKNAVGKVPG